MPFDEELEILQELIFWKDCAVAGCSNKVYCGIESSLYCFPHSVEYLNILPHFLDEEYWSIIRNSVSCQK